MEALYRAPRYEGLPPPRALGIDLQPRQLREAHMLRTGRECRRHRGATGALCGWQRRVSSPVCLGPDLFGSAAAVGLGVIDVGVACDTCPGCSASKWAPPLREHLRTCIAELASVRTSISSSLLRLKLSLRRAQHPKPRIGLGPVILASCNVLDGCRLYEGRPHG